MTEAPRHAPLSVRHCMLDSETPCETILIETREALVYALIGSIRVYANGAFLGTIGGRATIKEPLAHVARFPAGTDASITLLLTSFAADCLIVSCDAIENRVTKLPYIHWNDTAFHAVGSGTHERIVGEVPTPPGFQLNCGQTIQEAGMISSYPPHATTEDMQLFIDGKTTWEESFFCVGPKPAHAQLYGIYPGNRQVNQTIVLENGAIVPMPLGSHAVQAAPDAWFSYLWFYHGNALQKSYNKWSHHIGTYLK